MAGTSEQSFMYCIEWLILTVATFRCLYTECMRDEAVAAEKATSEAGSSGSNRGSKCGPEPKESPADFGARSVDETD